MLVAKTIPQVDGLAARMVALEEAAYIEFSHIFGPRFRAYFKRHGLTDVDAEDLAGSCITDIALKVEKYRQMTEGGFSAWVFTLAGRALSDWARDHLPMGQLSENLETAKDDDAGERYSDATLAVEEALSQLSEVDRALIRLRNLDNEQTFEELAKSHGITPGAARARHSRARKKLKSILEKDRRIENYLSHRKSHE